MVYEGLYAYGLRKVKHMEKRIQIDGKEVGFRASALTPRLYRHKIGRDMIQDLNKLQKDKISSHLHKLPGSWG